MILLGEQIVKFKDGTQKTLEEFVLESSGGGGAKPWTNVGSVKNMAWNTSKAFGSDIDAALAGDYVDMCILVHAHDASYTYADAVLELPVDVFKSLSADNPLYLSTTIAGTGQNALVFQIFPTKSGDAYSAYYKGANHFYNSGTQIDIKFYFK